MLRSHRERPWVWEDLDEYRSAAFHGRVGSSPPVCLWWLGEFMVENGCKLWNIIQWSYIIFKQTVVAILIILTVLDNLMVMVLCDYNHYLKNHRPERGESPMSNWCLTIATIANNAPTLKIKNNYLWIWRHHGPWWLHIARCKHCPICLMPPSNSIRIISEHSKTMIVAGWWVF